MKVKGTLTKSEINQLQHYKYVMPPDKNRKRKGKGRKEYPEAKRR